MANRNDGRLPGAMRPVLISPDHFRKNDVLIKYGDTTVLCFASIEERVPQWLLGSGTGWLTAEYNMLPTSSEPRQSREKTQQSGRTQEIQRLIGRALRAALRLEMLPQLTLRIDCDVIVADGGTRTASITGAMIALCNLIHSSRGRINPGVLYSLTAAVSAGIVRNVPLLDLNYQEDSSAGVDANFVGLSVGGFAEVQASAEHDTFNREQMDAMFELAGPALQELYNLQSQFIKLDLGVIG
jgi:ribonuclease PH